MSDVKKRGKYLNIRMFEGPKDLDIEEEWNRFYNVEHAPAVVHYRDEVIRAYRYVAIEQEGEAPKYITIYELGTPDAMSYEKRTEEGEKALLTEWYRKMKPHFRRKGFGTYKQIYPEE